MTKSSNRALLATLFIALLGFCVEVFAISSDHDRGHAGGKSHSRDHDTGGQEQNHDNDLQSGEWSSQYQERGQATNLNQIGIGEPTDPDNSYNRSKEFLKDHR